ncbi:HAD family hydrolase [Nocardioides sp. W7]|uniref:HAD family hydrolase n=1 Tax=Nocardioides sp. W7 TaxID=2931390 RepID=UPI001FD42EF5|nr:HAD family hydrolase [Nocardioides sp. W7]
MTTAALSTWHEGPVKDAVVAYVDRVCTDGSPDWVAPEERVAVFDNDGTLWCEKPMPIQLDFVLRRLAEMADADPTLRDRQPWQAAYEHDHAWLARIVTEHYAGDDTNVRTLGAGIVAAFANLTVEQFEADAGTFLRQTRHPTLKRTYLQCSYAPMLELLAHLRAHGFTNYIASGGGRDFMRPISDEVYGISRERVIGSAVALAYAPGEHGGAIVRQGAADYLDDGPEKPVRIWNRIGRRPILAAGNSDGDLEMLDFTQHRDKPSLRLLVLHDDAEREFEYVAGAENALDRAQTHGWTVVSMKNDWATVF